MANKTIYVRDEGLWKRARKLAGDDGLSIVIHDLLSGWVQKREAEMMSEQMTEITLSVGGEAYRDDHGAEDNQEIAFTGRLLVDSEGLSVAQIPHLRVYQTRAGKLLVHRSWLEGPGDHLGETYRVYPSYEALVADPLALDTMWIEGDEELDREADHTPELRRQLTEALGRQVVVKID